MNSMWFRRALWLLGLVVILVGVNHAIASHERTLERGKTIRLELAPRDPRAFMQGDYMALRFAIAEPIAKAAKAHDRRTGRAVLTLDADHVGRFARLDDGTPLVANEARLEYRLRNDDVRIVTNAYFFEEGTADRFESARYGEFRVRDDGVALLTHLLNDQRIAIPTGKR